ncbi:MAG: hypothetical protein H6702_02280 [Myxococcales bacterium]|nr:hypothetical protein [Myxococcales bacterium]
MRGLGLLPLAFALGCGPCPQVKVDPPGRDNPRPGVEGCAVCAVVACVNDAGDGVESMRLVLLHSPDADGVKYEQGLVTVKPTGSLGGIASKLDVGGMSAKTLIQQKVTLKDASLAKTGSWTDATAEVELVWTSPRGSKSEVFTVPADLGKCE